MSLSRQLSPGPRTDEYLRRNLLHAKAVGAVSLAESIVRRLHRRSRIPIWLALQLAELQLRIEALPPELAAHRDEVSP